MIQVLVSNYQSFDCSIHKNRGSILVPIPSVLHSLSLYPYRRPFQMPPARGILSSMGPSKGPSINNVHNFLDPLVFVSHTTSLTTSSLGLTPPPVPTSCMGPLHPTALQLSVRLCRSSGLSLSADADDGPWSGYGRRPRRRRAFCTLPAFCTLLLAFN